MLALLYILKDQDGTLANKLQGKGNPMSVIRFLSTIIHSRDIWPMEHPFYHLDVVFYITVSCLAGLAMIGYNEWLIRRDCRKSASARELWMPNKKD